MDKRILAAAAIAALAAFPAHAQTTGTGSTTGTTGRTLDGMTGTDRGMQSTVPPVTPGTTLPGTVTPGTVTPGTMTPGTVTPGSITPGLNTPDSRRGANTPRYPTPGGDISMRRGEVPGTASDPMRPDATTVPGTTPPTTNGVVPPTR